MSKYSHLNQSSMGDFLPRGPHAVSASMPTWKDVVDYEEGHPDAMAQLTQAYPRFLLHSAYRDLCSKVSGNLARAAEYLMLLPSEKVAEQCVAFCGEGRVVRDSESGLFAAIVQSAHEKNARQFWQHSGQILSSRASVAALSGDDVPDAYCSKSTLRQRIAEFSNHDAMSEIEVKADDVYLYPTGMAAIFAAHQSVTAHRGGATIQLGFPYVDTLKIQQKWNKAGCVYVPYDSENDFAALEKALAENAEIAAVFVEMPSNPLLRVVDLEQLSNILRPLDIPLIVDDTIGSWANIDVTLYADIIATSLTKSFSGAGDVMGGSMIVNPNSPMYAFLKAMIDADYEDILFGLDAFTLENNSRDFMPRAAAMGKSAMRLASMFGEKADIDVYYPGLGDTRAYDKIAKPSGGYGGLLSIVMNDPAKALAFYDALELPKGPSLGTNFSLSCPYTLLAHFAELDEVKKSGVLAHLLRVSVGVEFSDIAFFERALAL